MGGYSGFSAAFSGTCTQPMIVRPSATLAGFGYGIVLWQLTRRGVIPIPEEV